MYDPQHFLESQDNSRNFGDPKSWLSGDVNSSPTHRPTQSSLAHSSTATNSNLDRVLFKDLVEIVPLVQSLIDRKASNSFTRRGSVAYTKTPSRESLSKKVEQKGRNAAQSIPVRKKRDGDKDSSKNAGSLDADSFSSFSSRASAVEKEELDTLRVQVEDLQKKVAEKEELLKSSEISKDQMNAVQAKLNEYKQQVSEKDAVIKAVKQQLSDAKIKLADKQAALEKLQWEVMTSNRKVEKLQGEQDSLKGQMSSFMLLFESLMKADPVVYGEDYDISTNTVDHLPHIDDLDEAHMKKMEEARRAYVAAVAAAKEKQDEESIAAAGSARLHLQSFVLT
ncbi:hypothetical protein D8674_040862 [Pyrus ussuriensis x Pyrus communis]|uniref:Uncharacterized protein n=1 Tax=Pyrus ussuriensis x Pyrus communis TaxID=2448454 RepID=A0A5N5I4C5_9ROSA|nr:hypothetical protein D8674_040862 [Pyrus ussuriensis x Pyrus communis]